MELFKDIVMLLGAAGLSGLLGFVIYLYIKALGGIL